METKKPNIFKAVGIGLSAYIVRASVITALSMVMSNHFTINVIANIVVIIIGGLYYNY